MTIRRVVLLGSTLTAAFGCDDEPTTPGTYRVTDPAVLSVGSPTKDEDPSVVLARDGSMVVAWFSDRGSNPDLYVTRTTDGEDWAAPVRVTVDPGGDFNPHLIQDPAGTFHLVWFRWTAPFRGHIWYNSSPDGVTWDPAGEVQVTRAFDVDDWVPTLARAADGTLLVYFVSDARDPANPTNEIYLAVRRPGETDWDPVAPIPGINSATEHDHLPFAALTGDVITLLWVRHDTSEPLPWENPESDVYLATSTDGRAWSVPVRLTDDPGNVVNLFPMLYPDLDGRWTAAWLSTRAGAPRVFEVPAPVVAPVPGDATEQSALPEGYSHKVAPTPTPGVFLGVWVQGPEGSQEVFYRFFRRD